MKDLSAVRNAFSGLLIRSWYDIHKLKEYLYVWATYNLVAGKGNYILHDGDNFGPYNYDLKLK
jgi:hypothetical protein